MKHFLLLCSLFIAPFILYAQGDFNPGAGSGSSISNPAQTEDIETTTARWAALAASPQKNSRSCCAYTRIRDTAYIYQFGGGTGNDTVSRYNIARNSWTFFIAQLPVGISAGTAITVHDSLIYIFGGLGSTLGSTLRYNVNTNEIDVMSPMIVPITDAAVVKYNDSFIYVIGGGSGLFQPAPTRVTDTVQLYDVNNDSYSVIGTYPVACGMMGFGIFGDTIICAGGWNGSAAIPNANKGVINHTDPTKITWTHVADYPADSITRPASYFVSQGSPAQGFGGGIVFAGGSLKGSTVTGLSYLWNFCTGSWQTLPDMPTPRSNIKATGARDSVAYVVAGFNGTAGVGNTHKITFSQIDGSCITAGVYASEPLNKFNLTVMPNPATTRASIIYTIDKRMNVAVDVFDALGRNVASLTRGIAEEGEHVITLSTLPSLGIYYVRLVADNQRKVIPMAVLH